MGCGPSVRAGVDLFARVGFPGSRLSERNCTGPFRAKFLPACENGAHLSLALKCSHSIASSAASAIEATVRPRAFTAGIALRPRTPNEAAAQRAESFTEIGAD